MKRVLVSRLDNAGDVVLAGAAIRAVAAEAVVTLLCSAVGRPAGELLPGVSEILVYDPPWSGHAPPPVDAGTVTRLVDAIAARGFASAAILTSFHQSPLPLALLLRIAGVPEVAAVSVDYPGSLLDHRLPYRAELHEVQRSLEVVASLGFSPPDDDRLALIRTEPPVELPPEGRYVVVHPGASVPARRLPDGLVGELLDQLAGLGVVTVVTGSGEERNGLTIPGGVLDLRGRTSFAALVETVRGAGAVVSGNTGTAHIAAATGTPMVGVFAPVVSAANWRPWKVPTILLGDQNVPCAGCRARACPLETQVCVSSIRARDVVGALDRLGSLRQMARPSA